ncbi:MAG: hypothetical protein IJ264_07740 [Clostridia bacterium]|nr:hypothetical protein [Clostridia bacterium]
MIKKRIFALIFTALLTFTLTACQDDAVNVNTEETTANIAAEETSGTGAVNSTQTTVSDADKETSTVPESISFSVPDSTAATASDPTAWTKVEIVKLYKQAAEKSNASVKSEHAVTLTKISINNEELGSGFDFIKKIMSTFISNNTEETNGITGGYKNLVEADISSAKAYAIGNKTAIEMVMHEQTDGATGDIHGGSVGHAIDVVGDISVVTGKLAELGLPIKISNEHTSIHYSNPVVKVIIDKNGKIISGTWRYTVEIRLENYTAFGTKVENTSVVMDNIITVNGGFNK